MIGFNPQQLPILMRREFWEHRWAFQYAPFIIFGLGLLLLLMGVLFTGEIDGNRLFTDSAMRELAEMNPESKAHAARLFMLGINVQFNGIMLIVLFFYLVGSLYDERKNRSILFWKSLPVSDSNTILSKLITAGLAVPLFYMVVAALLQIVFALVISGFAMSADISVWENVWKPANFLTVWFQILVAIPIQMLWLLPIFGWCIFCSAFAPRVPWLIAIAIPGLLGLFQSYLNLSDNLKISEYNIWILLLERLGKGILPISVHSDGNNFEDAFVGSIDSAFTIGEALSRFGRLDMWVGIIIGLAFLYGAVYLRSRATDK